MQWEIKKNNNDKNLFESQKGDWWKHLPFIIRRFACPESELMQREVQFIPILANIVPG